MDIQTFADPVLAIGAHPEDIDIHAGGTVAQLIAAGKEVAYVLCTSGNRGTNDPTLSTGALTGIREDEQRAAAGTIGVDDITFLRHDDGDLQYETQALRQELVEIIRQKRPRSIITHDPYPGDGSHDACAIYPDHLAVGRVVFEAAYICAPGPLFYPEHLEAGLKPHKSEILYLIMSQRPDAFVEIAPVWERKMQAVSCFESQGRHQTETRDLLRKIAGELGEKGNLRLAEGFRKQSPG